jgi:RNA polymerase sigma-70 factor (ECF subfamily)
LSVPAVSDRASPPRLKLSDDESSEAEYAELRRRLVRAVRHYCPGWLSDIAEDLVQTAVIRVLEARRNRAEERELSAAYLYRAAYSTLVNEIRSRRRRKEVPIEQDFEVGVEGAGAADPERSLSALELGEAILRCLGAILRDRKLAVTLHLQGYTIEQAADLLRWSRKRTENLIYRGLGDLRDCLSSEGMGP